MCKKMHDTTLIWKSHWKTNCKWEDLYLKMDPQIHYKCKDTQFISNELPKIHKEYNFLLI